MAKFRLLAVGLSILGQTLGGVVLYFENNLQRYFRDIQAAAQHALVGDIAYENYGQYCLELSGGNIMA